MKIKVGLFGTLGNKFSENDPINGIEIEIHEGSTVGDLLNKLDIPKSKIGIVSIDGKLVPTSMKMKKGNFVKMYHPISGG